MTALRRPREPDEVIAALRRSVEAIRAELDVTETALANLGRDWIYRLYN